MQTSNEKQETPVDCTESAPDPLDRCKQIRNRVAELEAEIQRLVAEHNATLGAGVVDADDMAWALGTKGDDFPLPPVCPMRDQGGGECESCQ